MIYSTVNNATCSARCPFVIQENNYKVSPSTVHKVKIQTVHNDKLQDV